jgi:thiol-disulfide isomerase/thioredoxin
MRPPDAAGRRLRPALAAGVAALVAILVIVVTRTTASPAPNTSTSASAWMLPRLEGSGTVSLVDFRGKPLVVDFFASWCTPCRSELPEFLTVSRQLGSRVGFVGVDSEENGDGPAFARQTGVTAWPLARDVGGTQQSGLRDALATIPGMPVTAFYDASGTLRDVRLGAMTGAALATRLRELFGVSA